MWMLAALIMMADTCVCASQVTTEMEPNVKVSQQFVTSTKVSAQSNCSGCGNSKVKLIGPTSRPILLAVLYM